MSRWWKPVLIVVGVVLGVLVALHLVAGTWMRSLAHAIHGQ
jgi:hypothetical protein